MKKGINALQNLLILTLLFVAILLLIKFVVKINNEKVNSSYLWNITFSNPQVKEGSQNGKITTDNETINFSVTLKNEGEFYEYTIDIHNKGSLDAEIAEITKKITSTKNILNANITYLDNSQINKGDVLKSGSKKTIKVSINYPKQKEKIYEELKLDLAFSIKYTPKY